MLYRNWNTSQHSYFSTLDIQTGECLHWILSLTTQWLPYFHRLIGIRLVAAQKFLGRNTNSAGLIQVLGTWSTLNCLNMINECYQVWTTLNSDFIKHKESVPVCMCACSCVHAHANGVESPRNSHLTKCHFTSTFFGFPE